MFSLHSTKYPEYIARAVRSKPPDAEHLSETQQGVLEPCPKAAHCELQSQFWIACGLQNQCLTFWVAACTACRMREALILIMVAVALGQAPDYEPPNTFETRFADAGVIRFKLSSGDYTLQPGTSDRIVLRWLANDSAEDREMRKIKVYADIKGSAAIIRTDGPTKKARIAIEIPMHTDIFIRLRGGDVRITGIEGNKDVSMTAGDLKIDLEPKSYAHVHASVTIGDLRGQALGISRDGFRNSFDWNGSGKYNLRASLFAGDLILERR